MHCTYRWYGEISLELTSANFIQSVRNLSRDLNIVACLGGGGHFNHAYVFSITLKVILPICNATLFFCYRSRPTARHSQCRGDLFRDTAEVLKSYSKRKDVKVDTQ